MKIIDNVKSFLVKSVLDSPEMKLKEIAQNGRPPLRASFMRGQDIPPERNATTMLDAYRSWSFACISVISQEMANIDLQLKRRKKNGDVEEVDAHPALDLLYKVNPIYSSYLLYEATAGYMELSGECFWLLLGSKTTPKEIWLLRPDWVSIGDSKDAIISEYVYTIPGEKGIRIPQEMVVPFKDFNPKNMYRGYGATRAAALAIDTDQYSADWNRRFFFNSARPSGALQTDNNLNEEDYERIREDWYAAHRGKEKAFNIAILEAGLKWQDVGFNQKDMDFIEGRKFSRDEICSIYRVPKSLIAISDDVNLAAIRDHRAVFLENTIEPKQRRFLTYLNEFFLPRYGDGDLYFDAVSPVPNDTDVQLRKYDNGLRHGWLTRNEVRAEEGRDPIEGGDTLFIPFGLQPIDAEPDPEEAVTNNEKARKLRTRAVLRAPKPSFIEKSMDTLTELVTNTMERLLLKNIAAKRAKSEAVKKDIAEDGEIIDPIKKKSEKDDEEDDPAEQERRKYWLKTIQRTNPYEESMKKVLKNLFNDQQSRVLKQLDNLEKGMKLKASPNDIANFVKNDDVFVDPLAQFILNLIGEEGNFQMSQLVAGKNFIITDAIKKYVSGKGVAFVKDINETTAEAIREAINAGIDNNEGISAIAQRISSVYDDARGYRSVSIARTEVTASTSYAATASYKQSDVVEFKEWISEIDDRTRTGKFDHVHPDGQQRKLSEKFEVSGEALAYPGDRSGSPGNIIQCRCTTKPVLKKHDD